MKYNINGNSIEVFTISPRTIDTNKYWKNIERVIEWSEKYDCTGILLFTGNDTYVEPWISGHYTLARTKNLSPLIAVNPVYMHPFTVAKNISSFAYLYKRKTYLNMVTGTALSYLEALNDHLSHDERYDRLLEYVNLIMALLTSTDSVSFQGTYYKTKNLKLMPQMPHELLPTFLFAGQSEKAVQTSKTAGGIHMQMLPPELNEGMAPGTTGVHFGLVTRENESHAWEIAHQIFPEDSYGQRLLSFSMSNTDSVWKMRLKEAAKMENSARPGYWLEPFRNFKADCPYFIGSYRQATDLIVNLIHHGITTFIIDIPAHEEEFFHINHIFKLSENFFKGMYNSYSYNQL